MKKMTIITPTYNRSENLKEVYKSLNNQTNQDFVWIIVDDGSSDMTKEIVENIKKDKKIDVKYYYKENGGKASALNLGLSKTNTEYCCCLDSDDILTNDAIEKAIKLLDEEKNNNKCCGIVSLRVNKFGEVLGKKKIPKKYKYITTGELYSIISKTELMCFYKYKCIRNLRFPKIENEKFISPTWFQYKVTEKYKFRVSDESFCVCEYLEDGMTKNKKNIILKNPKGYTLVKKESLKNSKKISKIIKHAIMYDYGSMLSENENYIKESPKKIASILCIPIAKLLILKRGRK